MTLLSDADGTAAGMFEAGMSREDTSFPVPFGVLSPEEREARDRNEAIVDKSLGTFVEVGEALNELRGRRQYRETHNTFEDYCPERFGMTHGRANQLIRAAEVVSGLDTIVSKPCSESQVRPLCTVDPDKRSEVWQRAVETAPNGKVTAAHVESVAREYREPDPAPESEDWTLKDAIKHLKSTMYDISQEWPQQYIGTMVGQLRSLADELTKYGKLRP